MRALALLLALGAGLVQAQGQTTPEALALLRKIHLATQKLSYTGTFVYQQGAQTETSRITRVADAAGGIEKLEALDGAPREIVRTRDTVSCYLPDSRVVKIDRRDDARTFPALLPDEFAELAHYYVITRGERGRVAGLDCDSVLLTPRDDAGGERGPDAVERVQLGNRGTREAHRAARAGTPYGRTRLSPKHDGVTDLCSR